MLEIDGQPSIKPKHQTEPCLGKDHNIKAKTPSQNLAIQRLTFTTLLQQTTYEKLYNAGSKTLLISTFFSFFFFSKNIYTMTKKDNEGAKMQPMAFLWVLPKGVTTKPNSFEDFIRNQLNYSNIVITAGSCSISHPHLSMSCMHFA